MKIPFIHSGGATRRLEEVVYNGDGLIFYPNEGFIVSDALQNNVGYFRSNWIESVDPTSSMLNNSTIGGYVLDHTSNVSGNIGGSISSDSSTGTQLIPKYNPTTTSAVLMQSLGDLLIATTNLGSNGHIFSTLSSDMIRLYLEDSLKGSLLHDAGPDGLSDLQDCIGTVELDGSPIDFNSEYKLAIYYRCFGNINTTNLNTFINMLML